MSNVITYAFGYLLAMSVIVYAIVSAIQIPQVEVNYLTGECVAVHLPSGEEGSCENMPEKYSRIFVRK